MVINYTDEELKELGIEEDSLTDEELLLLLAALHSTLSTLEDEIRSFYSKYGKDGVVTFSEVNKWVGSKQHLKRIVVLNQTISDTFIAGFSEFGKSFTKHLQSIVLKESQFFGVTLDIDKILNTVWGIDELNYLQRLNGYLNKWIPTINNDLKLSILRRDSITDILTNVAERGESMEKILKRLWRTEANAVSSIARREIYEQLGFTKYRFIHKDKCICEVCTDLDGAIFPVSEYTIGVTANPLHPNCRDTTVPVLD